MYAFRKISGANFRQIKEIRTRDLLLGVHTVRKARTHHAAAHQSSVAPCGLAVCLAVLLAVVFHPFAVLLLRAESNFYG
jgi:hypothetical protein